MITIPRNISAEDRRYLEAALTIIGSSPALESIWLMMDLAWREAGCDHANLKAENLTDFYNSPVWLLNGLFIEQHDLSIAHRRKFSEAILAYNPARICDYGGGFGSLARMVAEASPGTSVELFDPHPHRSSLELSEAINNLCHVDKLTGPYDVMVATDVFEHVADPLLEVENTCRYLRRGGSYLIANCFYPVIKCHLPCTFHFRNTFNIILAEMNLQPVRNVAYGTVFEKTGDVLVSARIRKLEKKSRLRFAFQGLLDALRNLRRQWHDQDATC